VVLHWVITGVENLPAKPVVVSRVLQQDALDGLAWKWVCGLLLAEAASPCSVEAAVAAHHHLDSSGLEDVGSGFLHQEMDDSVRQVEDSAVC